MRRSRADSAETHRRIVAEASRQFRAHGIAGVGVADIMGALGLTVGGFYRHFESKDALVAEAIDAASNETTGRHAARLTAAPRELAAVEVVERYLSQEHCDAPAHGCPVAALCSEIAHENPSSRAAFTRALKAMLETTRLALPGDTPTARDARLRAAASMVGAVVLARASDDRALSSEILSAVREGLRQP